MSGTLNVFSRNLINFIHPRRFVIKQRSSVQCNNAASKFCSLKDETLPVERDTSTGIDERKKKKMQSLIEPAKELDLSHITPHVRGTYNFAAYADSSFTIQQLIKLGVKLYLVETNTEATKFILSADFERSIKPVIQFLSDIGVPSKDLGHCLTEYPEILLEEPEILQARIEYLQEKKFSQEMISCIIVQQPHWLSFRIKDIDTRLGYIQNRFQLSGDETRQVAFMAPKIILCPEKHIFMYEFVLFEELKFSRDSVKNLLLTKPSLMYEDPAIVRDNYFYLTEKMNLDQELIEKTLELLLMSPESLVERYLFLKFLDRAQFDPNLSGFIPPLKFAKFDDEDFATKLAKSNLKIFYLFVKTL